MNCPVCEHEIKDGQMYCGHCGYEIRIVPDFEAELENNIQETMSGVVSEISPEDQVLDVTEEAAQGQKEIVRKRKDTEEWETDWDDEENEDRPSLTAFLIRFFGKHLWLLAVLIVAVAVIVLLSVRAHITYSRQNSYTYQYQMAVKEADAGNYEEALSYLSEALRIESDHPEARMLSADYMVQAGNTEEALLLYRDMMAYDDYAVQAYRKYIALLESQERYLDICHQLENCEIAEIRSEYNHYLAEPPIFSVPEGTYESAQMIRVSANTNGIIYYTMDGSIPDEADNVYTGPILLESGHYEINAVFINQYGMMSQVFASEYDIEAEIPTNPTVMPEGGDYTIPEYIVVEVPQGCTVYYTSDGSTPTRNSLTYSGAICMPLGNAMYRFIAYSEEQAASEVTQVEYHLNLDNPLFSEYQAMLITASGLTDRGLLLNMDGEVAGVSGTYSYAATAAFVYEGEIYYLMTEYYTDASGTYSTQTKYAVSVAYGILYKTNVDRDGHYTVIAFE